MEQPFGKYLMFQNRLEKVFRHVSKQARRLGVSCYRIYDHDLPEFPFIIELYGNSLYVSEYKRRHSLTEEEHEQWLEGCKAVMAMVTGIPMEQIFVKLRQRKAGRQGQYQKVDESRHELVVEENGLKFLVNLSDYLDTGLFLDHRDTRKIVRDLSKDKAVLNLFCYTGSFSVYAAAGVAKEVVSVDLSRTYLTWAERNMKLNFPGYAHHKTVQADVIRYLKEMPEQSFDLIVMDPPTFSNSKRMEGILDTQRDHVMLINDALRLLKPGGMLFFSTNYTKFVLDIPNIKASKVSDITKATTPFDFQGKLKRVCFRINK